MITLVVLFSITFIIYTIKKKFVFYYSCYNIKLWKKMILIYSKLEKYSVGPISLPWNGSPHVLYTIQERKVDVRKNIQRNEKNSNNSLSLSLSLPSICSEYSLWKYRALDLCLHHFFEGKYAFFYSFSWFVIVFCFELLLIIDGHMCWILMGFFLTSLQWLLSYSISSFFFLFIF